MLVERMFGILFQGDFTMIITKHFLSCLLYSGHANYDALSFANNVRGDYCEMVQKRRLVIAFICNLVIKVEV